MRTILLLSALCVVAVADLVAQDWQTTRSPKDLHAWILKRYEGRATVPMRLALGEAKRIGWLQTSAERALFKRQFRGLTKQHGHSGRVLDLLESPVMPPSPGPLAAATEKEYNDSEGYANEVGALSTVAQTVTGTLAAREVDSFAVTLAADGVLQVAAQIQGTAPEVQITSPDGDEVKGMAWSKAPPLSLEVPAGRYFVRLYQPTGSSSYSLSLTAKAQAVPALALNKLTSVSLNNNFKAFRVILPEDGRVTLKLASSPGADTKLWLLNSSWRYMFDVDDAGSVGTDAGLNALLPKGTYLAYLSAGVATTTKITTTFNAAKIPALDTTALNGVHGNGEEDFDLYKVVVGKSELTTLAIRGNGSTVIGDSYLLVYDSNMALALESDDENASASALSSISATLPAGTYYAASVGYYGTGGYAISKAKAIGSTVSAKAGTNQVSIKTQDLAATLQLSLKTPSRIEFRCVEGTLADAEIFVLDAKTGLSLGWEDDSFDASSCSFGTRLPAGDYAVIVKDWSGGTGSVDVRIIPPMQRWGAAYTVMSYGHQGNPLFVVIGRKQVPATNPLPGVVTGNLLIDLSGAGIFPLVLPTGGILDFKAGMTPNSGLFVQTVEFETATRGAYSNLLY